METLKRKVNEISSFRDPSGYVYYKNNLVYRKINKCYFKQYSHLMNSGLYKELVEKGYLIKHEEVEKSSEFITICVDKIPFISYPYEWCFEQLKDASLLTLKIQEISMKYNMILKDASAYNIQFLNGKPIFIDTLSFDFYEDGKPWGAYGQFCKHFMAPLILMIYVDENLNCLLKNYIDGIPLDIATNILKNRGGFIALEHIKWHNKSISNNNSKNNNSLKKVSISKNNFVNMILMMENQIAKLKRKKIDSEWNNYYENTNYDQLADNSKVNCIREFLTTIKLTNEDIIWDLGANDGKYSRIASEFCNCIISFDIDINVVNRNYNTIKEANEQNILPLLLDLNNPTPAIGFGGKERMGLNDRAPVKIVMALALIHHICISNNVPFESVAKWFSSLGKYLIIEFVPKNDSQVQKLLMTRNDIFNNYNIDEFEKCFSKYYKIVNKRSLIDSQRVIYLMEVI